MFARVLVLAVIALLASAALARVPELPRELRGRVELRIKRCRPIGRGDALLEAVVRVRAKAAALALPPLQCGAYDDDGEPFFLAPVTGTLQLAPRETRDLTVRFAADAKHRECGCSVRGAPAREAAAPEPGATPAREPDVAAGVPAAFESDPSEPAAFAAPGLRFERMLAAHIALRVSPSASGEIAGRIPSGARIAVDRIERGWKLARTADGFAGWLPSDASTADLAAPERVAERLAPLRAGPSADGAGAPCDAVARESLGDLVAAWRPEARAVFVRPLWFALAADDRRAFGRWASECFAATRVIDSMSGNELLRD